MTIGSWILCVLGVVTVILGVIFAINLAKDDESGSAVGALIMAVIVGGAMIVGPIVYSTTEKGQRALKDQESNFTGGISRTVEVYDINGNLIKSYEGKFDIETDKDNYILFDDENGQRHIIYFTTGTIIVDEKK